MPTTPKTAKWSDAEKAAMKEHARELKASTDREAGAQAAREKIEEMTGSDREMAERIHALIAKVAPELAPRTWYGMPAYAKDGETICFFQPAAKFKYRYATFGFSDKAKVDEGSMWPNAYSLTALTDADEARLGALIKKAVS